MKIVEPPEFNSFKELVETIILKKDKEKYNQFRDFNKSIILAEAKRHGGHVSTSMAMDILGQDPVLMAENFVRSEIDEELTEKEKREAENSMALLNIHIKSMMESIVAEINQDLTRDSSYRDILKVLEGAGFDVIYEDSFFEKREGYFSSESPSDYLTSVGAVFRNLKEEEDNRHSYEVEVRNTILYNSDLGIVSKIEGDFDGQYSPSMTIYAEIDQYPNKYEIKASSSPVDYQKAFSISFGKEMCMAKIQKLLESKVQFRKNSRSDHNGLPSWF